MLNYDSSNLDQYDGHKKEDTSIETVKTDDPILDEAFGYGLSTKNLIIIQAPSGAGKTTLLMRFALNCLKARKKIAYISIGEQDRNEIFERLACMHKGINYSEFNRYREDSDVEKIHNFRDFFKDYINIYYTESPFDVIDITPEEFEQREIFDSVFTTEYNEIIKDIDKKGIKFIFLDYMGSDLNDDPKVNNYIWLGKFAAGLKNNCSNKNVMVMTAMQTNKIFKGRLKDPNFRPDDADEEYMSDSIGPARKATICATFFKYKGNKYLNFFKNRLTGETPCLRLDIAEKSNYKISVYIDPEKGF